MNMHRLIVATLISLSACVASAQAPAPAMSAADKEKLCQDTPEKCARSTEKNRMQKAMEQACEKNPESCMERRMKAGERHREMSEKKPPKTPAAVK